MKKKPLQTETVNLDVYQANNLLDTLKEDYLEDLAYEIERNRTELAKEIADATSQGNSLLHLRDSILKSDKFKLAKGEPLKLCDKAKLRRHLKKYEGLNPLTPCQTAIVIVVVDVIFIFLGLFGLRGLNQDRLVNAFLRTTNNAVWSGLALQITRFQTASNLFWKCMGIFGLLGALFRASGLKFVVAYLREQLSWWEAVKFSALMIAQLIAWLASEGLAFCAQVALFAIHVEQTFEDALKMSHTCESDYNFWQTSSQPTTDGSFSYFRGTDNRLWKICLKDGNQDHYFNQTVWHTKAAVFAYEDFLYFQGTDDRLWKVNEHTGVRDVKFSDKNWKCKSTPIVAEDYVYFQGTDDRLWRVSIFDGSAYANFNKNGKWKAKSPPVVQGNYIYFQSTDNKLWKVDVSNGEADAAFNKDGRWKSKTQQVVSKAFIYFQGTDDRLWKVSISKNTADENFNKSGIWKSKSAPAVDGDFIYFQGTDNKLWKVNVKDGVSAAEFNCTSIWKTKGTPCLSLGKVLFQGTDNKLWVLNSTTSHVFEYSKYYFVPNGTYQNTSKDYRTLLKAQCKAADGTYKDSELEISTLKINDVIVNNNGKLKLVEGSGPATISFIPQGKYLDSSVDVRVTFSSLNQRIDSTYSYADFFVRHYSPITLELDNINGKLLIHA